MEVLVRIAEVLTVVVFAIGALIGIRRARMGAAAGGRAALAFSSLAVVLLLALLPEAPTTSSVGVWVGKLMIVVFFAFPYLLFRFTEAFHTYPGVIRRAALGGFLIVVGLSVGLPDMSGEGNEPSWMWGYLITVLVYWTALSAVTAAQLWRSGKGQPTLARKRMRLMSLATCGLNLCLFVALIPGGEASAIAVVVQIILLATGVMFLLGFSPPRMLRYAWREAEEAALRDGVSELMKATTREEVAELLLPHAVALVGASAAELQDADGRVVASCEVPRAETSALGRASENAYLEIELTAPDVSTLRVRTSSYTPFFGPDDIEALSGLAAIADLAFERCRLFQVEREVRATADLARQEAEKANLAKSEFLARMSHELRTPLNVILGFAQILETSDLSNEDRDAIGHMIKAGRHLLELINEVLDLARIEAGRLSISSEPVMADELVRESTSLIVPMAAERGITIHEELASCEVFIRADRQRSKQVLLNLLSNAVKYNRDNGQIFVSGSVVDGRLQITVADTGPGLPEAYMDKIFEPFERMGADGLGVEGTGLGLALSRQLMGLMDGKINVLNRPGEGASFTIDLPVVAAPTAIVPVVAPEDEKVEQEIAKSRLLLLIEDNLSNVHLIARILKQRPAVALMSAMQAGIGLELAREHQPDVILLDLHLPDLDGAEVLHRLRADPATRHLPVIIVSAQASPGQVHRLLDAGAVAYLTKPLELKTFLETIDDVMSSQREVDMSHGVAG